MGVAPSDRSQSGFRSRTSSGAVPGLSFAWAGRAGAEKCQATAAITRSGQRQDDSIAAALRHAPAQRLEYADRPEPAHHVVANRNNRRRFGKGRRPFDTEHARYGCADLIEAGFDQGLCRHGGRLWHDQSGLRRAQLCGHRLSGGDWLRPRAARQPVTPAAQAPAREPLRRSMHAVGSVYHRKQQCGNGKLVTPALPTPSRLGVCRDTLVGTLHASPIPAGTLESPGLSCLAHDAPYGVANGTRRRA